MKINHTRAVAKLLHRREETTFSQLSLIVAAALKTSLPHISTTMQFFKWPHHFKNKRNGVSEFVWGTCEVVVTYFLGFFFS